MRLTTDRMHTYEVTLTLPRERLCEDARDRIALLTTAFAKLVADVPKWRVLTADFDKGCIVVAILAPRFRNVRSGRVIVDVVRKDDIDPAELAAPRRDR